MRSISIEIQKSVLVRNLEKYKYKFKAKASFITCSFIRQNLDTIRALIKWNSHP